MNRTDIRKVCLLLGASLLFIALPAVAQSMWTGIATVSRYGDFPTTGNYAASNSFQKNTLVEVTNLENGRRTTVIVVGRLDDPGLFVLLSQGAGDDLDIGRGEIVQVRASLAQADSLVRAAADDRPYSQDPDINPAAVVSSSSQPAISSDTGRPASTVATATPESEPETASTAEATESATTSTTGSATGSATQSTTGPATAPANTGTTTESGSERGGAAVVEAVPETTEPSGPTVGGVAAADEPNSESAPPPMDEPNVPRSESGAVSSLNEAGGGEEPEIGAVASVAVPSAAPEGHASVLDLLPEPQLDETERFVLLTPADEPNVPKAESVAEAASQPTGPEVVGLQEPAERSADTVFVVTPPEPKLAEDRLAEPEGEKPEELLSANPVEQPEMAAGEGERLGEVALAEPAIEPASEGLHVDDLHNAETPAENGVATLDSNAPKPERGEPKLDLVGGASTETEGTVAEELKPDEPTLESEVARIDELRVPESPKGEEGVSEAAAEPEVGSTEGAVASAAPPAGSDVEITLEPAEPRPPAPSVVRPELPLRIPREADEIALEPALPKVVSPEKPDVGVASVEPEGPTLESAESATSGVHEPGTTAETTAAGTTTAAGQAEASTKPSGEPIRVAVAKTLASDAFYLQLAVFSEAQNAQRLSDSLSERYPITVFKPEEGSGGLYKVLVGPLSEDESGALLFTFRSRGYRDAFVRREP